MVERELQEWKWREEEMDKMQQQRLDIIRSALYERDSRMEKVSEVRVEHLRHQKMLERDAVMDEIQKRRVKTLRILSKKRETIEPAPHQRDIITQYADFGSQVYAPPLFFSKKTTH